MTNMHVFDVTAGRVDEVPIILADGGWIGSLQVRQIYDCRCNHAPVNERRNPRQDAFSVVDFLQRAVVWQLHIQNEVHQRPLDVKGLRRALLQNDNREEDRRK